MFNKAVALLSVSAVQALGNHHVKFGKQLLSSMYTTEEPQQLSNTWDDLTACQYYENGEYYDYSQLTLPGTEYYTGLGDKFGGFTIYFNMCQSLQQSSAVCNGDYFASYINSYNATTKDLIDNQCQALSNNNATDVIYQTGVNDQTDSSIQYKGIQYTSPVMTGEIGNCERVNTQVALICDESVTTPVTTTTASFDDSTSPCTIQTQITAAGACPVVSLNSIFAIANEYYWLWGVILLILGLFLTFFGRKLFLAAVFIAALVIVTIVIIALFYGTCLSDNNEIWVFWVMLSVSALIGCIVGVLLVKYSKFAAAVIGAWGGYMLGLFINDLALWPIGSAWVFWLVNVGCAIICAILSFIFFNPAVIIGTAFIGGYLLMRGIAEFAGGFQNEYTIVSDIKDNSAANIVWTTYAYLAGWVIVAIIGSVVQFKMFDKMDEEEKKHPYDRLS